MPTGVKSEREFPPSSDYGEKVAEHIEEIAGMLQEQGFEDPVEELYEQARQVRQEREKGAPSTVSKLNELKQQNRANQ